MLFLPNFECMVKLSYKLAQNPVASRFCKVNRKFAAQGSTFHEHFAFRPQTLNDGLPRRVGSPIVNKWNIDENAGFSIGVLRDL